MNATRKCCALALALPWPCHAASPADSYPDKPVRIVIPVPAGGTVDVLAPAKTPVAIIARLHEAASKAIRAPETAAQFEAQGAFAVANSPKAFDAYLRREYESNARIVKAAGLRID